MRLIDADEYLKSIRPKGIADELWTASEAYLSIMRMPTVDAVPVRHGRWTMVEGEIAFWDMCSECGKKILHRTPYYDFCPNCGADMRKDGGDGSTD